MDLTPSSAVQQNNDRQRQRQAGADPNTSPLPDPSATRSNEAHTGTRPAILQQRFAQRMQQSPPDPLLAAASETRRAQVAASMQRNRSAQNQQRQQASAARRRRRQSATPAAATSAAPEPAEPAVHAEAPVPQPTAADMPQPASAAAAARGGSAPGNPSVDALMWSQVELSQVPLAQVQLFMRQGGTGMSVLQAQQIHWAERQRHADQRMQQRQARRRQQATDAATAAAGGQVEQGQPAELSQQHPAVAAGQADEGQPIAVPQQQQLPQHPRRSGRIAQQQARQEAPSVLMNVFAATPQAQQPAPPADGRAALQPVVEGLGFPKHEMGPRTLLCTHCQARLWPEENKGSSGAPHGGSLCCYEGKSCSPTWQTPPQLIKQLFTSNSPRSRQFRKHARLYNSALQMASSGLVDVAPRQGISTIAIRGALHHLLGPLAPAEGQQHQFAQLYIIDDPELEVESRIAALGQVGPTMDAELLQEIQNCLHTHNTYVREIKQTKDLPDMPEWELVFKDDGTVDRRRYNAPTAAEVAGFMPGDGEGDVAGSRDIRVQFRDGRLQRLSDCSAAYDPLHFVLFHPRGEPGWHPGLMQRDAEEEVATAAATVRGWGRGRNGGAVVGVQASPLHARGRGRGRSRGRGRGRVAVAESVGSQQRKLTSMQWAAFWLHDRPPPYDNCMITHGGRLFQEWCVDQYCKVEAQRLSWVKANQQQLRVDLYQGVADALQQDNLQNIGCTVILPSSFTGGPRHMHQLYQDAMALVRKHGKPDLFITMTSNPKWSEVTAELLSGQSASDRPDIVERVFKLKLDALKKDLLQRGVFGRVVADIHVVEWQKRGLPHAHILLILAPEHKPAGPEDFDRMVCAELPDKQTHPELYAIVTSCMLHGPCGAANPNCPCMRDGKCTKGYPREFSEHTLDTGKSYPVYRRRNDGRRHCDWRGWDFDNKWVVPFNPYLTLRYDCHINVEVCSSVAAVKYLYKYVYKGHDRAMVEVREAVHAEGNAQSGQGNAVANRDEVTTYLDGRYVSASEGIHRLLNLGLHKEHPNVIRLQVHLPKQQPVVVPTVPIVGDEHNDPDVLRAAALAALDASSRTTLTEWFTFNANAPEGHICHETLYHDFPGHFRWDGQAKQWKERVRHAALPPVGRMYFVQPSAGEKYYLRMLLCHVPGAQSFLHLRTVDGVVHPTFQAACAARGLLADDAEWKTCMQEAAGFAPAHRLRALFATLLVFNDVANPEQLWNDFKNDMCEDLLHVVRATNPERDFDDEIWGRGLREIAQHLQSMGGRTLVEFSLPQNLAEAAGALSRDVLVQQERDRYSRQEQATLVTNALSQLNPQQQAVYDGVMAAVTQAHNGGLAGGNVFFVDGVGGAGKTFTYSCLLAAVRSQPNGIALSVASSGIAALLLPGGRTAHSRFKIPVQGLDKDSVCFLAKQSPEAALVRAADLIVWDEAPMMHKHVFEAVDRSFRDIMGCPNVLFGGKVVVLGGDFRQILPVVPRGNRGQIVAASLKRSSIIWPHVHVFRLHENMRVQSLRRAGDEQQAQELEEFAAFLKRIGDGIETTYPSMGECAISIPPNMCCGGQQTSVADLIEHVYGGVQHLPPEERADHIIQRAILTPLNQHVDTVNMLMMEWMATFDGGAVQREYLSADGTMGDGGQGGLYPTEFLNSLNFSGVPPHKLVLRVGCPIMLLRNLTGGLANGTRLIVTRLGDRVIEARVATGPSKDEVVCIPRLGITPSDSTMPFTLRRLQFPVRPAFAMTINKSQGQTLAMVGVYLPNSVFSHGQLYVALSRVGRRQAVCVLVEGGWVNEGDIVDVPAGMCTANVVYTEVLT